MAVVVYQCDVCKRSVQRAQNRYGIDVVGSCIITDGCRGRLNLTEVKPSYAIGHSTPPVHGLNDWRPRKVLYTHDQNFLKQVWEIDHYLNNHPAVTAYVQLGEELVKSEPIVDFISNDKLSLTFPTATIGIAQLTARSASDGQNISTFVIPEDDFVIENEGIFDPNVAIRMTAGQTSGVITIATRIAADGVSGFDPIKPLKLRVNYISPLTLQVVPEWTKTIEFSAQGDSVNAIASPWASSSNLITIKGYHYLVRSGNIHFESNSHSIVNGSAFFIEVLDQDSDPDSTEPKPKVTSKDELVVLLANEPYSRVDRVMDSIIDISVFSEVDATSNTGYINSELWIAPSLPHKIFPSIISR